MPFGPSSFLLLVAMPGAPSSVLLFLPSKELELSSMFCRVTSLTHTLAHGFVFYVRHCDMFSGDTFSGCAGICGIYPFLRGSLLYLLGPILASTPQNTANHAL